MASIGACLDSDNFDATVDLWVKRVTEYSSQYNATSWAATCVIGTPTVYPRYGDINGAWAQGNLTANEFIVVEFAEKLFVTALEIYETFNAGAVIRILASDPSRNWITIWETSRPQLIQESRCFVPPIEETAFATNQIKLELDCTASESWCEIDAIKLKGKRHRYPKPPPISELSGNLKELVNNPLFSDVKFFVDDSEVYAHRAILAVRSSYFNALLCNGMLESRLLESNEGIKVDGISHSGFIAMMHYIYTNDFDVSTLPIHMVELIRIGDKFSLTGMKTLSFYHLCRQINLDNVIDIYRDAVENLPHLEKVEDICVKFISRNLSKITRLPSFSNLPHSLMLTVIQEATSRQTLED